ncbi:MAG: aldo/keto reductase [Deltaproteobacteria bacterium]|nr:aldo/keto reductase [Deltaproteobacteria bacterium]
MLKRTIPRSGEMITAVGLGTSGRFNVGSDPADRAPVKEVLRLFVEMGGQLVDTSPSYRRSEGVLGDLSAELGIRKSLFLATKVSTWEGREEGIQQMEHSFKDLHTNRVDLMQVHNLKNWQTHLKTLRRWKDAGRIRYLGVTTSEVEDFGEMESIIRSEKPDFMQLNYNIQTRDAEKRLLPLAADTGTAVLVNRPFQRARLFRKVRALGTRPPEWAAEFDCKTWGQFMLKFILSHPAVTCTIPATRKPKHLVDNMGAGMGRLPDKEMRRRMVDLVGNL